jgi:uncharacterized protein
MSNLDKTITNIEKEIKKLFNSESSGHDIYHLKRVYNLAIHIQKKEGGDKYVIGLAAFLHDIHRIIKKDQYCSPKESLPIARKILENNKVKENCIVKILHCIEFHEEYSFSKKGKTVNDLETLIVQDADNLDSIGANGIGRTFTYGGFHNIPMWKPEKPFTRKTYTEEKNDISIIHHFHSKLLKIKDNMNTKTAFKMAKKRDSFLRKFLDEFLKEWKGNI